MKNDFAMKEEAVKAYKTNIIKVYGLVYSIVAIPVAYYGINYIALINGHLAVTIPLLGLVMTISVIMSMIVQRRTGRDISLFLSGLGNRVKDKSAMKTSAGLYPLRITAVMVFGWIVLLNAIVLLPVYFLYSPPALDLVICNLLVFSCGLMSAPMTWFICESTASSFLSIPEIVSVPEEKGRIRISLGVKIMLVCLILILTLILNTSASMLISVSLSLTQGATIVNLLVISVQGVLAAMIISLLFARSLNAPIANMRGSTGLVGSGDLTVTVPSLANDELGDASLSFNGFIRKLAETISAIKESVGGTVKNAESLQAAMGETGISVEEINGISREMQTSITEQSAIISELTAIMRQIAGTIANQDRRINDQSSSVTESSSAIEQMIANIQSIALNLRNSSREFEKLQSAMGTGNGKIEELKKNVTFLSTQSDTVFEANAIIKGIASQTNLLAMNAAIEAAHAGEAGSGFAVVADEIRKLAEVSNQQSKLISDSLKALKATIQKAVSMAAETGASFADIMTSVQAVDNIEREIKHAIDEQSSGSSQILQALTAMNDITAEVHTGSNAMLEGSNSIMAGVSGLLSITGDVGGSALRVVDKAKTVKDNTDESLRLLNLNGENMKKIDALVGFFKIK